ncbi:MAG: hypothetical protein GW795_10800 [Cyanobacteria bacterium]|nr:hypothetical protein [Cyanobacteria bacterium CG_2015-16_32_12]NCO79409.1 hypothetical protein [Cyanobacteria bacterium CG_2015-22_32_23]NCQ42344.1 hypothetical protein [Cyanobacteria bacterium CG_2015-04_32_10]NCS85729.1 hypothetical protein [Cyanobacteria bacterium CG_2015-02_32_10]
MIKIKTIILFSITLFLISLNHNTLANHLSIKSPQLVSQKAVKNYCKPNESLFLSAETKNFWLNICGGDLPNHYVGVSKKNGNSIRLPLDDYNKKGDYFSAYNGNVNYLIIFNTPKGSFLTVTEGKKELFREPLISW